MIDAAAWQPCPRFACLMLAAAVQQRSVPSAARLDAAMRTVGRVRHKAYLRLALRRHRRGRPVTRRARPGAALPEIRTRASRPARASRRDTAGRRRYLDAEWDLPNGEIVVLEIDGGHHLDVAHWQADMKRERGSRHQPSLGASSDHLRSPAGSRRRLSRTFAPSAYPTLAVVRISAPI